MQLHGIPSAVETVVRAYQLEYGPQLCHILIRNISGEAARSDLDILAEPLKKLVTGHMMANKWLYDALFSTSFTSQKVTDVEKNTWLRRIIL